MITEQQAQAIVQLLALIRPDWNPKSMLNLFEQNHDKYEFKPLAGASINAALNPTVRTPAVIFMPGSHWANPNTMSSQELRMLKGFEAMAGYDTRNQPTDLGEIETTTGGHKP